MKSSRLAHNAIKNQNNKHAKTSFFWGNKKALESI
jgi:hypothetical protein